MVELFSPFVGELDLSQIASRIGWEFMKMCKGQVRKPPTEVAKLAVELYSAIEAAQALVNGKLTADIPGVNTIPPVRRRMLIVESTKRDANVSKYEAIRKYTLRHSDIVQGIASGKREPTSDELEQLCRHFGSLSLVLVEAGL